MTSTEAAKLVAVLLAAYPSAKASGGTSEVYEKLLADLDYATTNRAIAALISASKWLPTVAEIRAAVVEQERGPVENAAEAWGDVLRLISRYGAYRQPGADFEIADPIAARVVAALTWSALCLSENQVADRARFLEAYSQIANQTRREQIVPQLAAPRQNGSSDRLVADLARRLSGGGD
jgi:hypothetical protein